MGGGKYNSQLRVLEINSFVDSSFFSCLWKTFKTYLYIFSRRLKHRQQSNYRKNT